MQKHCVPCLEGEDVAHMTRYPSKVMGLPDRTYDPKAWSREDLFREIGGSQSDLTIFIQDKLKSGEWEQVWKRGIGGRRVKAYRRKR